MKSCVVTIQIKATERHFPVMLFVTVFKLVLTVSLRTKSCQVTFQIKATQQAPVVQKLDSA